MTDFLLAAVLLLLVTVAGGLVRVARGPSLADRMVAGQLFGTTGVGILLLLAQAMEEPALRDVALVFALLAVVVSVAFVKRGWVRTAAEETDPGDGEPATGGGGR